MSRIRILSVLFLLYIKNSAHGFISKFQPMNPKQHKFQTLIHDKNVSVVFGIGSAGTGKTLLSCQESLNLLHHKKMKKIIITRPTVSVEDEEIGFLPGTLEDKMSPWTRPIFDNLYHFYTINDIHRFIQENKIEICPIGFMRGRTFMDSIIIVDEAQNTTPRQMKMILTRIGKNSKLVIVGDLKQSDLDEQNGLQDIIYRLNNHYNDPSQMFQEGIGVVRFDDRHIVRHPLIEKIVNIYND